MRATISYIKGMFWGAMLLVTIINLSLGYFNITMLKDKRHMVLFNTDANCNFMDQQQSDFVELTGLPEPKRGRK